MPDLLSISTWRGIFTRMGSGCGWILAAIIGIPLVVGFGLNQYAGRNQQAAANNAAQNGTALRVNGEAIDMRTFQSAVARMAQQSRGSTEPGEAYAQMEGQTLDGLITETALKQEAQRRGIRPSEGEIDSAIARTREQLLGKNGSDADWDNFIVGRLGMTQGEYRDNVAQQLLLPALANDVKAKTVVTDDDAKAQHNQVKLQLVLIPSIAPNTPVPSKGVKPLPDAEAKKKADDLLAQVKGGADIGKIARENSGDTTAKKDGVMDWRNENASPGMPPAFGALFYGKDFDDAVRKAQKGQLTDVVKLGGIGHGYAFAKVLDRRTDLPKNFDVKKEADQLKSQKAQIAFEELAKDLNKKAKVEIVDPDVQAFYDYYKYQKAQQQLAMSQFGQADPSDPPVSQDDVNKLKTKVSEEFEAMLKRRPDDVTAAKIVAANLKSQAFNPAVRDRLIGLYETVLKSTEDRSVRFELADLYREKKQDDMALKQYDTIKRLLDSAPPYDMASMQEAQSVRTQLVARYRSVNQPAEASDQEKKAKELDTQIKEEQRKQAEQQKAAQTQMKAGGAGGGSVNLSPGASATVTEPVTAPAAASKKPDSSAPKTGGTETGNAAPANGASKPSDTSAPNAKPNTAAPSNSTAPGSTSATGKTGQ